MNSSFGFVYGTLLRVSDVVRTGKPCYLEIMEVTMQVDHASISFQMNNLCLQIFLRENGGSTVNTHNVEGSQRLVINT